MATPYMSLTLPTPSVTLGPTYAAQVNAAFTTLDSHNHSLGFGQQVPSSGIGINADLPFGTGSTQFNATFLRSLRFTTQAAALALNTDLSCVYVTGGNLYYNNGSGQPVQITSGASLAAVGTGSISGLTAPASAAYSSGLGAFTWTSNTNVAAAMDFGPLTIRDTGVSAKGISVLSPAGLAAAYSLTLPAALPATTLPLIVSAAGAMSALALTTSHLSATAGITRGQLASVGQQLSSSSGAFTTTSATLVDVTNLTVTITTTGRPVALVVQSDGSGSAGQIAAGAGSGGLGTFVRGGTEIARYFFQANTGDPRIPGMTFYDTPVAGTYTYKVQALAGSGGGAIVFQFLKMLAFEL